MILYMNLDFETQTSKNIGFRAPKYSNSYNNQTQRYNPKSSQNQTQRYQNNRYQSNPYQNQTQRQRYQRRGGTRRNNSL